jgi:hypothetical protein
LITALLYIDQRQSDCIVSTYLPFAHPPSLSSNPCLHLHE